MYCTTKPCVFCMGRLANVGISEVIYDQHYDHELSESIANHGKIKLRKYNKEN